MPSRGLIALRLASLFAVTTRHWDRSENLIEMRLHHPTADQWVLCGDSGNGNRSKLTYPASPAFTHLLYPHLSSRAPFPPRINCRASPVLLPFALDLLLLSIVPQIPIRLLKSSCLPVVLIPSVKRFYSRFACQNQMDMGWEHHGGEQATQGRSWDIVSQIRIQMRCCCLTQRLKLSLDHRWTCLW